MSSTNGEKPARKQPDLLSTLGKKPDLLSGAGRPAILAPRSDMNRAKPMLPPDPLAGLQYPGDVEGDAAAEMNGLRTSFMERAKQDQDRFRAATDSEFWFCVCFESREQKDAFLAAMNWTMHGNKYLDGVDLAAAHKIPLPPVELRFLKAKPDPAWNSVALPLEAETVDADEDYGNG